MVTNRQPIASNQRLNLAHQEEVAFYLFISPWLIGFIILILGPVIGSFILSLSEWNMAQPPVFVGINNYLTLITGDELFRKSLQVTSIWVFAGVPLQLTVAYTLALLLNQKLPGVGILRTLYYLPSVVSGVAVALLWEWILQPQYGILNTFLRLFGIPGPPWLGSETWALPALILMSLWSTGATMVIFLAGLQSIPVELYEAAGLDGAGQIAKFFRVTLPLTTPVVLFNLVIGIIGSFQVFTQAFIMTRGGPNNATLFYVYYLYKVAFEYSRMGYASAMAWILFVIVLVCTLAIFRSSARWVYYEGGRTGDGR